MYSRSVIILFVLFQFVSCRQLSANAALRHHRGNELTNIKMHVIRALGQWGGGGMLLSVTYLMVVNFRYKILSNVEKHGVSK